MNIVNGFIWVTYILEACGLMDNRIMFLINIIKPGGQLNKQVCNQTDAYQ